MVQTRQSAAFEARADLQIAETPRKPLEELENLFEQLRQDGIELPRWHDTSPSKRRKSPGHDCVSLIKKLHWTNSPGLATALASFRLQSPNLQNTDSKLNHLLYSLNLVNGSLSRNSTPASPSRRDQGAPSSLHDGRSHVPDTLMGPPPPPSQKRQTATSSWPPRPPQSTELQDRNDPPSPTLSVKHLPESALADIPPYPSLPPTEHETRAASPITVLYAPLQTAPLIPYASKPSNGLNSLNTSFTTSTTSVNTSFTTATNDQSVWSKPSGSQEPGSPATTVASLSFVDGADDPPGGRPLPSQFPWSSCEHPAYEAEFQKRQDRDGPLSDRKTNQVQANSTVDQRPHQAGLPTPQSPDKPLRSVQPGTVTNTTRSRPALSYTAKHDQQIQNATNATGAKAAAIHQAHLPPPVHARIKRIPEHGLRTGFTLPASLEKISFPLKWEFLRLVQAGNVPATELHARWEGDKTFCSLRDLASKELPSFRSKSEADYQLCSFNMKMRWTNSRDNDEPLFKLEVLPPSSGSLNCWQSKYGADRILSVEVDPLRTPPKFLSFGGQIEHIQKYFLEMLDMPQEFLGRTWKHLHTQEKKANKHGDADARRLGVFRFIFLGTDGDNSALPHVSLSDAVCFALPLPENSTKTYCKAFARFDLFTSSADETISFHPRDIMFVKDHFATRDPPDTRFNDERFALEFEQNEVYEEDTVMNDGCCEIPEWTMRQIGLALGLSHTPSAVQFRCAGAKGMFFRSRPTDNDDEQPDVPPVGHKLFITESQSKVKPKEGAANSEEYDKPFYTVRINSVSHALSPSVLYKDFLPILVACGVPSADIERLYTQQATSFTDELLAAINDRSSFRKWLHEHSGGSEAQQRENSIPSLVGFPRAASERAIQMLESGFEPKVFEPLGAVVKSEIKSWTDFMIQAFRMVLPRSTMALAVVDPYGVLEPGEVHLCFSTPFYDRSTGRSRSSLDGVILIGRNPSAGAHDIQKVQAVYKPELSHIQDVIVFSRKGPRPLAGKLSGGDCDGDRFWACWEPKLVKPFKNRPAPQHLPDAASFGIGTDTRKLGEIVEDPTSEESVRKFIRMGTENRLRTNWLGVVTKMHERLVHMEGMSTQRVIRTTNLKDLLIDSDKNGYTFSKEALDKFKRDNDLLKLPTPAYFAYTDSKGVDGERTVDYAKVNDENIIDRVFFWILKPKFEETLEAVGRKLKVNATSHDADLTSDYVKMLAEADVDDAIKREVRHLEGNLTQLKTLWAEGTSEWSAAKDAKQFQKAKELWDFNARKCRAFWSNIQPLAADTNKQVEGWLQRSGYALTQWERRKASAVAKLHNGNLMWFAIIGDVLCQMKADSFQRSRTVTFEAYTGLIPRKTPHYTIEETDDKESDPGDVDLDDDKSSDYGEVDLAQWANEMGVDLEMGR